jgi:drug/metabolite transporter (DMT)-like permease
VKPALKAHLFILGANIIYGVNYAIGKVALQHFDPFGIVLLRVSGALILFTLLYFISGRERIESGDHKKLIIASLFGVVINQLMFFKGLSLTSEIHSALIMITTPLIVLIMAWIILKDRITWLKTGGIILGAIGVIMLISSGASDNASPSSMLGDLFITINATSYAIFLIIAKPLMAKYSPFTIARWIFTYGIIFVLPFGIQSAINIEWQSIPASGIWALSFVIIFATVLAYLFNILGLNYGSPTLVSIYIYTQPVIATIIAIAMGSDSITLNKVISAILVFGGVALVSFTGSKKPLNTKV